MGDVFRSRRRRLGYAALAVAMVSTFAWMKSFERFNLFRYSHHLMNFFMVSLDGNVFYGATEGHGFAVSFERNWGNVPPQGKDAWNDFQLDWLGRRTAIGRTFMLGVVR